MKGFKKVLLTLGIIAALTGCINENLSEENQTNAYKEQFTKVEANESVSYGAYDYDSIMHYGSKAFSENGEITIDAHGNPIGQRSHLSKTDIYTLRSIYGYPNITDRLAILKYDSAKGFKNVEKNNFSMEGFKYSYVASVGDFDGDGNEDYVVKDSNAIGIYSYMDTTTPYWKTVVNKSNTGIRFGE